MTTTFAELIRRRTLVLNDGYRTKQAELATSGIPILRVAEIGDGFLTPKSDDRISEEYRRAIGPKLSEPGDVLLTTKGTVGRRAIVPESGAGFAYSPQVCFFRVLDDSIDRRWLYYWLGGAEFWNQALGVSTQTDMAPYISLRDLRAVAIDLPSITEQRAVAGTLGALDDKIESNRRAVELIGRASSAMFRRWRGQTRTTAMSTFGAFADVYGGATPTTSVAEYWGGGLAWATPTDVTGLAAPYLYETTRTISAKGLQSCTAVMHPPGSIFMTSRATIGAFAINQVPAATNQGFIVVRPKRGIDKYFLFEEMRSRVEEFLDNANGSTFLEISRGRFRELPLAAPAAEDISRLHDQLDPLHAKAAQLTLESDRLIALRDSLLPELLSGRLSAGAEVAE